MKEIIVVYEDGSHEKIERGIAAKTNRDGVTITGLVTSREIAMTTAGLLKMVCDRGLEQLVDECLDEFLDGDKEDAGLQVSARSEE